ncbi:glycosyltransferase [Tyzzerella sp. OttesenSCG-928-J15]|nr:glycosyltransferase [Tyzzerella sp. OttesenSCG-928-J15]
MYRNADIFLSTSLYESFPSPPGEPKASGTAVLSTYNGGTNTYAVPCENCL